VLTGPSNPGGFDMKDCRLSAACKSMGGTSRCGDLCPRGCAAQVANESAAYADGILLS
jgi:hypothetical protein